MRAWLPSNSTVTIPAVYLFDEHANVIIMDDAGEDAVALKALLIGGIPSPLAVEIGAAVGEFLGRLHEWGKDDHGLLDFFDKNDVGRNLTKSVTYERLVSTVAGESALPVLNVPPLDVPQDKIDVLREVADTRMDEILTSREAFTMGDFWPGNILVSLDTAGGLPRLRRIYVIDWEMAKCGLRGLDVGQFSGEIRTLWRFYPAQKAPASALLAAFVRAYFGKAGVIDGRVASVAVVHLGNHLVIGPPRYGWQGAERIREVVLEGVDYIIEGHSRHEWTVDAVLDSFLR